MLRLRRGCGPQELCPYVLDAPQPLQHGMHARLQRLRTRGGSPRSPGRRRSSSSSTTLGLRGGIGRRTVSNSYPDANGPPSSGADDSARSAGAADRAAGAAVAAVAVGAAAAVAAGSVEDGEARLCKWAAGGLLGRLGGGVGAPPPPLRLGGGGCDIWSGWGKGGGARVRVRLRVPVRVRVRIRVGKFG